MYDVIVIGAGVGGYTAAIKSAKAGMKTAIIETAEFGGTCLNRGCIPTKYLVSEAHNYCNLQKKLLEQIYVGEISFDYIKVIENLEKKVATLTNGIQWLLQKNDVDIYCGTAEFIDPDHIMIHETNELLEVRKVIIASGSSPQRMSVYGNEQDVENHIYTTDNIFYNLKNVPNSIAIVGGGAVGLELAFIYSGLGSDVTIIEQRDGFLNEVDHDIEAELMRMFSDKKIRVITRCHIDSIFCEPSSVTVIDDNEDEVTNTEVLLFAMGRKANIEKLRLNKANIVTKDGVICTDSNYRTSNQNVYAVGDVNGKKALAYAASAQAENVVADICGMSIKKDEEVMPVCLFLDLEIAYVGVLEREAKKKNIHVKTAKYLMSSNGRSRTDDNGGFMKIVTDKDTGVVLGGICVCSMASELISYITVAIESKMTISQLIKTVFPHPTYSESLIEAAELIGGECIYMM